MEKLSKQTGRDDFKPKKKKTGDVMFGGRLRKLMDEKKINDSDLARLTWGVVVDERGYTVAKNRQLVGRYVRGEVYPDHATRVALCEALKVSYSTLFPDEAPERRPGSGVVLTTVDRMRSRLILDVVIPTEMAMTMIKQVTPYT